MASRRKRGPVALRHWLSPGLPLSDVTKFYAPIGESRQFGDVRNRPNVGCGSSAAPQNSTIPMAAIEGIPATRKRLFESQVLSVCFFPESGRSDTSKIAEINFR